MSLLFPIQGSGSRLGMRTMGQRIIQAVGHKAFADADDAVATHLEGFGHLLIGPARIRSVAIDLEQDTGMRQLSGGSFAFRDQLVERVALFLTQGDFMFVRASCMIFSLFSGLSFFQT